MKRLLTLFVVFLLPVITFAQSMYSDAIECMNNGEYKDAKVYWEALNNSNNTYGNKISICNECIKLQAQASKYIREYQFIKAKEIYLAILRRSPNDKNAKQQIAACDKLAAEYKHQTYINSAYSYTLELPVYMTKSLLSTNENVVYLNSNYDLQVNIKTTIQKNSLTNTQILAKVAESYLGSKVTHKSIKENWIIISGYLPNGKVFYEKAVISTRKSQYGEIHKILVSAKVTNPKNEKRGNYLAECVCHCLVVNSIGPKVQTKETDVERWLKARQADTKESYKNYLKYAPSNSLYKEEAQKRKALCEARENYKFGYYISAKANFEKAQQYLTQADRIKYEDSFYRYCVESCNSIAELQEFVKMFPNHYKIRVIKGCFVKVYCFHGLYSHAKAYVKNNYDVAFDEDTSYSRKQWYKYINDCKKKGKKSK